MRSVAVASKARQDDAAGLREGSNYSNLIKLPSVFARKSVVRVLIEISLPAHTLLGVRQLLGPGALATGVIGHLEETGPRSPCAGPAQGGSCSWVPCWVSLHCEDPGAPGLDDAIQRLRAGLVRAAREGGLELLVVPAAVQLGDRYLRLRDVAEVPPMAAEDH